MVGIVTPVQLAFDRMIIWVRLSSALLEGLTLHLITDWTVISIA